jgi:2-keto-myo-inositol isomerase
MSTVRGHELSVPEQIKLAGDAGYDAIEPWIRDVRKFIESGGSLADLKKQIDDAGLTVESAIGFAQWIVDDDAARAKGLAEARADMELLKSIGGKRIAAPPIGAHKKPGPDLPTIARRYRKLLELGAEMEVTPQLELWGFSKTLSKLGELAYVATEAGHPDACVLPDFYHIYKGGSDFAGLKMIEASRMHVFHVNDYPADPPRETIGDEHRVYPGDGVCELPKIIGDLVDDGFSGCFSLELFNREYWKQDPMEVAKTGLAKMKAVVDKA